MLDAAGRQQSSAMVGEPDQNAVFANDRGDARWHCPAILQAEHGGIPGDHGAAARTASFGMIAFDEVDDEVDRPTLAGLSLAGTFSPAANHPFPLWSGRCR